MSFTFSSGKSRDEAGFIEQRRVQIQLCRFSKNCVSSESQLLNRQSYLMMKLGNFWLPCKVRICEHLRAYHNRSFVTEMKKNLTKVNFAMDGHSQSSMPLGVFSLLPINIQLPFLSETPKMLSTKLEAIEAMQSETALCSSPH